MMRAGYHTRANGFGNPDANDEVAGLRLYLDQGAEVGPNALSITGMQPERIGMRNLIEPLGVASTGVDQVRQAEGGQQDIFALAVIDVIAVYMALI